MELSDAAVTAIVIAAYLYAVTFIQYPDDSQVCSTDTECAERYGGNGDPEPE